MMHLFKVIETTVKTCYFDAQDEDEAREIWENDYESMPLELDDDLGGVEFEEVA